MAYDGLTRAQRTEQRNLNRCFGEVLGSAEGRQVLAWVLTLCGVYNTNLVANAAQEGRRAVGLALRDHINEIDPFAYVDIQREIVLRMQRAQPDTDEGIDE